MALPLRVVTYYIGCQELDPTINSHQRIFQAKEMAVLAPVISQLKRKAFEEKEGAVAARLAAIADVILIQMASQTDWLRRPFFHVLEEHKFNLFACKTPSPETAIAVRKDLGRPIEAKMLNTNIKSFFDGCKQATYLNMHVNGLPIPLVLISLNFQWIGLSPASKIRSKLDWDDQKRQNGVAYINRVLSDISKHALTLVGGNFNADPHNAHELFDALKDKNFTQVPNRSFTHYSITGLDEFYLTSDYLFFHMGPSTPYLCRTWEAVVPPGFAVERAPEGKFYTPDTYIKQTSLSHHTPVQAIFQVVPKSKEEPKVDLLGFNSLSI